MSARQRQLLEQASAEASDVSDAALRELRRWARSYPRNSTYTINYALGLLSQSHIDDAASMAQHAMTIEDGSFADAYNIGLVLWLTGRYDEGRAMLTRALARAGSAAERDLAEQFAEENSVWKAQP